MISELSMGFPILVTEENFGEIANLIRSEVYTPEFKVAVGDGFIFVIFHRAAQVVLDVTVGDHITLKDKGDNISTTAIRNGRSFEAFVMNKHAAKDIDFETMS